MIRNPRLIAALAAAGLIAAGAVPVLAAPGNRVPAAPDSTADFSGEVGLSPDGIEPALGEMGGSFLKGDESWNGDETTTVNFSLPRGVTVVYDEAECEEGIDGYCIMVDTNCDIVGDGSILSVNDNSIDFHLACEEGEGFEWMALASSLIQDEGDYPVNVEFKVTSLRREKGGNMWQIRDAGELSAMEEVPQ